MDKDKLYKTRELLEITGETRQRIQYWILNGIVSPYDPSTGTGTNRLFSFSNLLEVMIAQALSISRIDVKIIGSIVKQIKRASHDYFRNTIYDKNENSQLVLQVGISSPSGTSSVVMTTKEAQKEIAAALKDGFLLMYLNLDILKKNLLEKIDQGKK